jgi:hypothetical protein
VQTGIAPTTFVGLDVHHDSISVALLRPGAQFPDEDQIANSPEAMRKLVRDERAPRLMTDGDAPRAALDGELYAHRGEAELRADALGRRRKRDTDVGPGEQPEQNRRGALVRARAARRRVPAGVGRRRAHR